MTEEIKKAVQSAEKELEQEKLEALKNRIKAIVKGNLEEIDRLDKQIDELNKKKQLLKKDIEDLKKGRLDLIEERQKVDKSFLPHYVVHCVNPNANPYYGTYTVSIAGGSNWISGSTMTTNGQTISRHIAGSYVLGNGRIIHIN